jgi:adenosylcobinamide-phosphate synthase
VTVNAVVLACAYAIDWVAGDPEWLPHPVRAIGRLISGGEALARPGRSPSRDFWLGALVTAIVVGITTSAAVLLLAVARRFDPRAAWVVEALLAWTALATGSLLSEARHVMTSLDAGDLGAARHNLSRIVGRDTASLDDSEIARGVIETLAESTCDGIVAPLCFLAAGGVPAALAYKAISTLDSMIGHRDHPYTYFGRVAARLDDVANFIPARLSAIAIAVGAASTGRNPAGALRAWRRDHAKHDSPNAGHPEAAMAGALGVRLGGTNCYDGVVSAKPYLNFDGARPTVADVRAACAIVAAASVAACVLAVGAMWVWR